MIATTLYGGLGNQMFIYAMSRAMSLRNNVPMAYVGIFKKRLIRQKLKKKFK